MPQIGLDSLVAALASSVAEAEHVVRRAQIRNLRTFFNDRNEPVVVNINVPSMRSDAEPGETDRLLVPLITLVNVSNMSISEMEVQFTTLLGDVQESEEPAILEAMSFKRAGGDDGEEVDVEAKIAEHEAAERESLGWSDDGQKDVAIDVSTSPTTSESGRASVTLKVCRSETPEGLARLLERLNRML